MSEGYRINAERIFQDLAADAYNKYLNDIEHIHTRVPISEGDEISEFETVICPEGIKNAICAIIFWGLSIEAFTNSVFKQQLEKTIGREQNILVKKLITSFNIIDKINYLKVIPPHKISILKKLYDDRNRFAHYKEGMKYTCATPDFHFWFPKEKMKSYYEIFSETISLLKEKYTRYVYSDEYIEVWQ